MSFCTEAEVRNLNKKLTDVTKIIQADILLRITEAESTVIVDLSPVASEAEIISMGASSKVINLLATWKSCELTLALYYGATREVDKITDIEYWRGKYNDLLKRVISGAIEIVVGSTSISPINYPVSSPTTVDNLKLYPRKGIPGHTPKGAKDDYKDDKII